MKGCKKYAAVLTAAAMTAGMSMPAMASGNRGFSIDVIHATDEDWACIAMINDDTVDLGAYVRASADENGEVIACLYRGGAALVLNKGEEWTEVKSGSVIGYIRNDCLMFGDDAKGLADYYGVEGVQVNWNDVNVFENASGNSQILHVADDKDTYQLVEDQGHWMSVQLGADREGYVSEEDVSRVLLVDSAIPMNEESNSRTPSAAGVSSAEKPVRQASAPAKQPASVSAAPTSEEAAVYEDSDDVYVPEDSYTEDAYVPEDSYTEDAYVPEDSYTEDTYVPENTYTEEEHTPEDTYTEEEVASDEYDEDSIDDVSDSDEYEEDYIDDVYDPDEYEDEEDYEEPVDSTSQDDTADDLSSDIGWYEDGVYYDYDGNPIAYDEDYSGDDIYEPLDEEIEDVSGAEDYEDSYEDTYEEPASSGDLDLMAAIIYCEAGNQPYEGMVAVGAVVMNRVASPSFPSTISDVIYQSGQFTPAYSGALASALAGGVPSACYEAASAALAGENPVGGALYFNTGSGMGIKIGAHQFY